MKVTKREPQLWRLGICLLFLQRRAGKTPGAMMSSCTSNAIRSRGCFGVSDAFAAFSPAMINLIRTWFVDFFQNSVSLLHSTRGLQTMSLCVFAQLIVPYPGHGLPYRVLSKNNAECPTRILKSYKDTPHGPSGET